MSRTISAIFVLSYVPLNKILHKFVARCGFYKKIAQCSELKKYYSRACILDGERYFVFFQTIALSSHVIEARGTTIRRILGKQRLFTSRRKRERYVKICNLGRISLCSSERFYRMRLRPC